jgi:putative transposase
MITKCFWRALKYEDVYLKTYKALNEAFKGIGKFINYYITKRLDQSIEYQTPSQA